MRVKAYTFEADVHCPDCTRKRFGKQRLAHKPSAPHDYDENGIDYKQEDREGNPLGVVFDIDEDPDGAMTHCGDCRDEL